MPNVEESERLRVVLHIFPNATEYANRRNVKVEDMTCFYCLGVEEGCEYMFDGYNTNGDCLASK